MAVEKTILVRDYINPSRLPDYDFVINPYTGCTHKCLYCYAEFMKRFSKHEEEWGDFVDIKNATRPINLVKLDGASILLSSVTDPYNAAEKKHKITKNILEQIKHANIKLNIVTKSDLVLRDIDLLKQFKDVSVAFSIATLDETLKQEIEPCSPSIKEKLDALKKLHKKGIKTIVYMSPIFPEITKYKDIIDATKDFTDEYWIENLNLRGTFRPKVINFINERYPQYNDLYRDIYKYHINRYWDEKEVEISEYLEKHNLKYKSYFYHERNRKS